MHETGMPEAAVNEYRNLCSDETDVTTTQGHAGQWQLDSIPQPQSSELSAQFHLGAGVLRLLTGHPFRGDVISQRANLHLPLPRARRFDSPAGLPPHVTGFD